MRFGIEVEMTGITREKASQVAASYLGGESLYLGTYYKTYAATDSQGRMWRFTYDGSIQAEKKENGERVPADKPYKTEMVSPICTYEDIPTIQEMVRQLRHKGAFSNNSCGIHIHVDASSFDARTLRNLANIFFSKEDLLFAALKVDPARWAYCSPTDERFIQELNRKRPQTMRAFQKIWYGGEDGSNLHYHQSRYHALNLHSVFSHGTVEFRLFNSTVEHAGKIKADIQLCLAICAQALNQRAASHTKTQTTNLSHLAASHGHDWGRVRHGKEAPAGKPGGESRLEGPCPGGTPAGTDAPGRPGTPAPAGRIIPAPSRYLC